MTRITLSGVRKEYGDVIAVDGVDITAKDGEFLVLLGPSGCGKTTTLRMVAGLETITDGEIRLDDEVVNDHSPAQRDLAMVFQDIALYPHMSVFKNIASPLRADNVDSETIRRKVEEAAAMLNIDHLLDRQPRELSGGQQQRVAIGRALVREPRGFLLDEPFSSLDQQLRVEMQKELKRLQRKTGVTTFFVTHNQEEALVLADRIAVMNNGRVQQLADPETLYREPANLFVAEFIGNPEMNLFDVEITDGHFLIDGVVYDYPTDTGIDEARTLAARPEDITPTKSMGGLLDASIELVEMRGGHSYLICSHNGTEYTIKKPESVDFSAGETVGLDFDFERINLYDADGQRVR